MRKDDGSSNGILRSVIIEEQADLPSGVRCTGDVEAVIRNLWQADCRDVAALRAAEAKGLVDGLSHHQQGALRDMVDGLGLAEIAERTGSTATVLAAERKEIFEKLGVDCTSAAIGIGIYAFSDCVV